MDKGEKNNLGVRSCNHAYLLLSSILVQTIENRISGAVYHVTSRGNAKQIIYKDGADRETFLAILSHAKGSGLHSCS